MIMEKKVSELKKRAVELKYDYLQGCYVEDIWEIRLRRLGISLLALTGVGVGVVTVNYGRRS